MRYGVLFLLLGGACLFLGALVDAALVVPWVWAGLVFAFVGAAYVTDRPRLLGKRLDGSIALAQQLGLLPFFVFTWGMWRLERLVRREAPFDEVASGLWVARRPAPGERLPPGVTLVVDLTAELPRSPAILDDVEYVCLPTLDAMAPSESALRELVARAVTVKGGVYAHCASGHGRSATFAAAMLVARGEATSGAEAEAKMRAIRPGVRLHRGQRELVDRLARGRRDAP